MRKRQRLAFLAIGGLGLFAAIAPGLTAGIDVPADGAVPAAGQGEVVVQGFVVTDIEWEIDGAGDVVEVNFTIVRSANGAGAVVAAEDERSGNAVVRVRLEGAEGASPAAWVSCDVTGTAGTATCDTKGAGDTMAAADLGQVNIIAFDRN